MTRTQAAAALVATLLTALAVPAFAEDGDPAAGETVFRKCAACHSVDPEAGSRVGPNLHDVVGRTTGTLEGFRFSQIMVREGEGGHVWTPEELSLFLENPRKLMPGTTMTFAGLKSPEDRANVIAYLVSVSGADASEAEAAPAN